jgi:MFS family permease
VGVFAGEGASGLLFIAGLNAGLRLLVIANGLSFVVAWVLVVSAAPGRRSPAAAVDQEEARGSYRPVLADRVNVGLAGLNVAATLLLTAPILVLPVFVLDLLHLPTWVPGALAALLTATAAVGLLFGAPLVRGRRRLRNLEIAAVLWALGCAFFLLAPLTVALAYAALVAGVLLLGLGEAFYAPTADALPAALAPLDLRGRYAALHQMAWGISEMIAPALGAAALAAGTGVLWLGLAAIALCSALAYRAMERPAGSRDGIAGSDLDEHERPAPQT